MNKKALYEHIMKNVAKEVKKALNEGELYDDSSVSSDFLQKYDYLRKNRYSETRPEIKKEYLDSIKATIEDIDNGNYWCMHKWCREAGRDAILTIKCAELFGIDVYDLDVSSFTNAAGLDFPSQYPIQFVAKIRSRYNKTGKPWYTFRGITIIDENDDIAPAYIIEYNGQRMFLIDTTDYSKYEADCRDYGPDSCGRMYANQLRVFAYLIK